MYYPCEPEGDIGKELDDCFPFLTGLEQPECSGSGMEIEPDANSQDSMSLGFDLREPVTKQMENDGGVNNYKPPSFDSQASDNPGSLNWSSVESCQLRYDTFECLQEPERFGSGKLSLVETGVGTEGEGADSSSSISVVSYEAYRGVTSSTSSKLDGNSQLSMHPGFDLSAPVTSHMPLEEVYNDSRNSQSSISEPMTSQMPLGEVYNNSCPDQDPEHSGSENWSYNTFEDQLNPDGFWNGNSSSMETETGLEGASENGHRDEMEDHILDPNSECSSPGFDFNGPVTVEIEYEGIQRTSFDYPDSFGDSTSGMGVEAGSQAGDERRTSLADEDPWMTGTNSTFIESYQSFSNEDITCSLDESTHLIPTCYPTEGAESESLFNVQYQGSGESYYPEPSDSSTKGVPRKKGGRPRRTTRAPLRKRIRKPDYDRPDSDFSFFCRKNRAKYTSSNPGRTADEVKDLMKNVWENMTEHEQLPYEKMHQEYAKRKRMRVSKRMLHFVYDRSDGGFLFFRKNHRVEFNEKYKNEDNTDDDVKDLMREQWGRMSRVEQQPYREMFEKWLEEMRRNRELEGTSVVDWSTSTSKYRELLMEEEDYNGDEWDQMMDQDVGQPDMIGIQGSSARTSDDSVLAPYEEVGLSDGLANPKPLFQNPTPTEQHPSWAGFELQASNDPNFVLNQEIPSSNVQANPEQLFPGTNTCSDQPNQSQDTLREVHPSWAGFELLMNQEPISTPHLLHPDTPAGLNLSSVGSASTALIETEGLSLSEGSTPPLLKFASKKERKKKKLDYDHPDSPFSFYCRAQRATYTSENREKTQAEIKILMKDVWMKMSRSEQQPYHQFFKDYKESRRREQVYDKPDCGFSFFCRTHRPEYNEMREELSDEKIKELMKVRWGALKKKEKTPYQEMYREWKRTKGNRRRSLDSGYEWSMASYASESGLNLISNDKFEKIFEAVIYGKRSRKSKQLSEEPKNQEGELATDKPNSGFAFFCRTHRAEYVDSNSDGQDADTITKLMKASWEKLSKKERLPYHRMYKNWRNREIRRTRVSS